MQDHNQRCSPQIVPQTFLEDAKAEENTLPQLRQAQVELTPEFAAAHAEAPAQQPSGGDFYNAFSIGDGSGDVAVVLGDVAGHSPEQTEQAEHMRELLSDCLSAGLTPADTLTAVNAMIEPDPHFGVFSTVFVGTLEAKTGLLTYASGGQEPGLIAAPDADRSGHVEQLEGSGSVVGAFSSELAQFEQHEALVPAGGTLLLYTDGISEARSPHDRKNWFGVDRLKEILAGLASLSPRRLVPALLERVSEFCRGRFDDDVSVMAIRRRLPPRLKTTPKDLVAQKNLP